MDNEILTGKKIIEAKKNTTDAEIEELLKLAEEQTKIDQANRAAQEKAERERYVREKAEKERVGKELAAYEKPVDKKPMGTKSATTGKPAGAKPVTTGRPADAKTAAVGKSTDTKPAVAGKPTDAKTAASGKSTDTKPAVAGKTTDAKTAVTEKTSDVKPVADGKTADAKPAVAGKSTETKTVTSENPGRVDIIVDGNTADSQGKKTVKNVPVSATEIIDEVIVDNNVPTPIRKEGISVGDVIGGIFEFIWTVFKLTVVISIVTIVVGFFLSREMLIRGRNGNLQCLNKMTASSVVVENKDAEKEEVKEWKRAAKPKKLTLESDDGYILIARQVIINKDSDKWAVVLHGYNGSMEDIYDIAMHYNEKGYNVLMPDLRASGESEGSFIGMGWLDRLDVINWIDVILDDYPSADIVIHGVDMGADTGLMISGEPIKSNIKAIVADSAYTSAWDVMKKEFKTRHEDWPEFPLMEMVNPVAKVWGGYTLREASAVKQVEKTSVPILLVQGGNDTYVTTDMAKELSDSVASSHKLVTIPAATHGDSRYADPTTYYNEVFDFTELHLR